MRITNGMMINTLRGNIYKNMTDLDKLQNQLSTGKKISKPSDDPVGIAFSLRLRNNLVENEQYIRNVDDGLGLLEATDSALTEYNNVLQRIRELTVQAANGTNDPDALQAIKDEVHDLREHILTVANTEYAGKFIFSGTATNVQSFSSLEVWQGNTTKVNFEIGVGVKVSVNVTGDQVFGDNLSNVFQTLNNLENDLSTSNFAGIGNRITELDQWLDKNNSMRSEVGSRVNRLDFTKSRLDSLNINFTSLLSKNEDADMGQLITQLKSQENVYKASLAAGARIIQPSLIDFMR